MPRLQTAQVANYDFGAPSVSAEVLRFKAPQGGFLRGVFANLGDTDLTVSVEVSKDNVTFAATTAPNNGQAVTAVVVPSRQSRDFKINLRHEQDAFIKVLASGGVRGELQLRDDCHLDIITV
jgi:hypothetical protein